MKLENTQRVSKIKMYPKANCKCEIGGDFYYINFDVEFIPGSYYPDYMDVNKFVMENLDGKTLNIEDAVKLLSDNLKTYDPLKLSVTAKVSDTKTHFDVEVTIDD